MTWTCLYPAGDSDTVAVLEVSRAQMSPLQLLRGGASASGAGALAVGMMQARWTLTHGLLQTPTSADGCCGCGSLLTRLPAAT